MAAPKPAHATLEERYHFRVQVPTHAVAEVLEAIIAVTRLRYGPYEQVVFRNLSGEQRYRPLAGSRTGDTNLVYEACDEISFTVVKRPALAVAVVDAILISHPHEEPVVLIGEVLCTQAKFEPGTGCSTASREYSGHRPGGLGSR